MRSGSLILVLVLVLVLGPGCASLILGPGAPESNADLGISDVLLDSRPADLAFGPHTGLSSTAQGTLAHSLDIVINRTDMTDVIGRTVFIPGFSGSRRPETARRTDLAWVSARLAERVVESGGRVSFDRRFSDFVLIPWIQVASGITTYREVRWNRYPIYVHEEDQRPAWLMVFLYDKAKRRLDVIEGNRTWQIRIDAYILGIIPVEWIVAF